MNKIQRIPCENARGCFSLSSSSFDFRETSVGDLFRLSEMSSRSGGDFFFLLHLQESKKCFANGKAFAVVFSKNRMQRLLRFAGLSAIVFQNNDERIAYAEKIIFQPPADGGYAADSRRIH
ncbi:hypothetical protein MR060_09940 [bacterium]|nr:hypothetical protein [bacterium]